MPTRFFCLGLGVVYLVVGIIAFIPALHSAPHTSPHVDLTTAYGNFLGLFPVNALHDALHIVVGIAGIAVSARLAWSIRYCEALFLLFGVLTVFGFVPTLNTLGGYVPIYGDDTWLHAATCLASGFFGFVAPAPAYVEAVPEHAGH